MSSGGEGKGPQEVLQRDKLYKMKGRIESHVSRNKIRKYSENIVQCMHKFCWKNDTTFHTNTNDLFKKVQGWTCFIKDNTTKTKNTNDISVQILWSFNHENIIISN